MGGKWSDLTGLKFGRLTVVCRDGNYVSPNGRKARRWKCVCDCGNPEPTYVTSSELNGGHTQSCGCYNRERTAESNRKNKKKYNDYEIQDDYVIMYTSKGEPFYVDLEDFWKVKDICWHKNNNGYLISFQGNETTYLHRFIMDCPDNMEVDHRYGSDTIYDNRKYNLRICTASENQRNKEVEPNKSGCVGVNWDEKVKKWVARIGVSYKNIYLGSFSSLSDAISARKNAEEKYFGEFSYDNSRKNNKVRD